MKTAKLPKITEAEFQDQVVQYARQRGWNRIAHFRPARTAQGYRTACQYDAAGFPDLVLVRERVVFAELKRDGKETPSENQRAWATALLDADTEYYQWNPTDWPEIESVLK